jgi:DNA repair protein RecO (recombination protein O)
MDWQDEGVILGVRPHGETSALVEVFTREHGRHMGLVMGGRSRRLRPVLQTGNHVEARWRARLEDHLGHMTLELRRGYAAELMGSARALDALVSLATLVRLLPERDPHQSLFEVTLFLLELMGDEELLPALMVRWELALLHELGFGLDLSSCAATGTSDDLVYVSPRSGRAVSRAAGAAYKHRLLPLPGFLAGRMLAEVGGTVTPADIADGFRLTGYFLEHRVLGPRGLQLPEPRARLVPAQR